MNDHVPSAICDVLIVGAGPVGLALANELHRWGVSFHIVDQKAEPERHSKACNLWPRTQEVFSAIGVLDRLLAHSAPLQTFSLHGYGKLLGNIAMDRRPSPYDTPVFIGQNAVEQVLSCALDDVGASVERRSKAVDITDRGEEVRAIVEHADGARTTMRARWLVGCEGGNSVARKAAGLDFAPERLHGRFIRQIDARLRWSRTVEPGRASFFLKDDGYLGILPLPEGHHRMFVLSSDETTAADRDPTLDEMQATLRDVAADPRAELSDPIWFSHGRLQHGVAPGLRRGRIFLAGDAGHVTIPIYGQGMNTGIQDAFNLAWKLAYVLRGWAGEELLDSYQADRLPVRSDLNDEQAKVFHAIAEPSRLQQHLVRWLGSAVLFKGPAQYFVRRSTELDIAYPHSSLNSDHGGDGEIKPGQRAPDASVVEQTSLNPTTLFKLIYQQTWTLLAFDAGQQTQPNWLAEIDAQIASFPQVSLRPVLAAGKSDSNALRATSLLDLDRFAHDAYHIDQPTLLLVRPDGYVAFRAAAHGSGLLASYLPRVLNKLDAAEQGQDAAR